jgi:hypothetical protein
VNPGILDLNARVVFFPVRHHSPACARTVRRLARELRPAAILIEGPSDFNPHLSQLTLPHRLPIAIYSYLRLPDGSRRGAFYPFCVYSPEWQAIQAAEELGVPFRFIDLPWAAIAGDEEAPSHRYADGELRRSDYVPTLCRKLGVEDFDALWDLLFEVDGAMTTAQFLERCHQFCCHARQADWHVPAVDLRREAFMAEEIRHAVAEHRGQILVVTGGFHSYALFARINGLPFEEDREPAAPERQDAAGEGGPEDGADATSMPNADRSTPSLDAGERGIALTPYSYERLDSLTGYEAGMPSPGFYHAVWENRLDDKGATYRPLLAGVARDLRRRGQPVSAADLIAVETTSRALAALRGHPEVWRRDLIDGIVGALIKEELEYGGTNPFLDAVFAAFRGGERGQLAEGTARPPLVHDLLEQLRRYDLVFGPRERSVKLELREPEGLAQSRLLHRVRVLGIAGYERAAGTDLVTREDLAHVWEQWRLRWSPEFDASCIEAAIYGPTLLDAVGARLLGRAARMERDAEGAALVLLDAGLMGLERLSPLLGQQLVQLVREDGRFVSVTGALRHLLYLYCYDDLLGTSGLGDIGALLVETYQRALWLLEGVGQAEGMEDGLLRGVAAILETFERGARPLDLSRIELVGLLRRVSGDAAHRPLLRGAVTGALWTLGEAPMEQVLADLRYCSDPSHLGDFLTGLFRLARETVQRHPELVRQIDSLLIGYADEAFLEALPALRLAFSFFTPREKHYLARTLLEAQGQTAPAPLPDLEVDAETAARALACEARLFRTIERYGLRGREE